MKKIVISILSLKISEVQEFYLHLLGLYVNSKSAKYMGRDCFHCTYTGHSAYVAISTKSDRVNIDGFLYPKVMQISKM